MSNDLGLKFKQVCDILDKHEFKEHNLIAILQEIQDIYSYLPEEVMTYVAIAVGVTPGEVFGVATFYAHFTLEPKGKHIVKICDGTACHVKKSADIISFFQKELGLNSNKKTSDDMMYTLEIVACLGCCGLAPVVVVDDIVYGTMNTEKAKSILEETRKEVTANA